jgi:hypothetical protein
VLRRSPLNHLFCQDLRSFAIFFVDELVELAKGFEPPTG